MGNVFLALLSTCGHQFSCRFVIAAPENPRLVKLESLLHEALFICLSNVHNQVILHHLNDLLRPIEILSLKLQKKNLHPFDAL
uniref:Secreted protein n=1 Tax=Romanomermis culicivorax TaxID=13658 RepID=A0A915IGA2_ROMCU